MVTFDGELTPTVQEAGKRGDVELAALLDFQVGFAEENSTDTRCQIRVAICGACCVISYLALFNADLRSGKVDEVDTVVGARWQWRLHLKCLRRDSALLGSMRSFQWSSIGRRRGR